MSCAVFERYEKKYLISTAQQQALLARLNGMITPDQYGQYAIRNIYYDTPGFDLIRASIEKPVYKEKLRLRGYGEGGQSFLELKKKYQGVVYKRRVATDEAAVRAFFETGQHSGQPSQIWNEIEHFASIYPLEAKVFIGYDRQAFCGWENSGLRITFDHNLRFRRHALTLSGGSTDQALLGRDETLMEIKVPGAFPLWLSRALSELELFPASFSKYGHWFKTMELDRGEDEAEALTQINEHPAYSMEQGGRISA